MNARRTSAVSAGHCRSNQSLHAYKRFFPLLQACGLFVDFEREFARVFALVLRFDLRASIKQSIVATLTEARVVADYGRQLLKRARLRVNLDPFEEFSDAQIWSALEKAHLAEFVRTLADGLGHEIADGGSNLRCAATIFAYSKRLFLASASVSSFALRAPFFERQMCSFSTRRPPRSTTKRTRSFS